MLARARRRAERRDDRSRPKVSPTLLGGAQAAAEHDLLAPQLLERRTPDLNQRPRLWAGSLFRQPRQQFPPTFFPFFLHERDQPCCERVDHGELHAVVLAATRD